MQLHYKKYGKGNAFIILHALYGSSDNWHSLSKSLSQNFEVFVPDLRNHGKSPHDPDHSYQALQQDVLEFIENHKIERPILLGHSMGGKTAMLFSLLHPELIEKLIIVDIAPKPYKSLQSFDPEVVHHMNILNAFESVNVSEMSSRSDIDEAFSIYIKDSNIRNFLLKNVERDNDGKFYWALNYKALKKSFAHIMDWPENINASTEVPTLFIRGDKSNYVKDSDETTIKNFFPKSEITTIFDAGHWVPAEQPERFLSTVSLWLDKK